MINFEQLLEATARPEVANLKVGAFSEQDVVNLILQRSEIIQDQNRPGRATRLWTKGDSGPLLDIVNDMGDELIRRAISVIFLEYLEISETIGKMSPKKVADIGCGYAFFDYFLYKDTKAHLYLIDLEESDDRHFGFAESGAAYSSLAVAKAFLKDNGVPTKKMTCINPAQQDVMKMPKIDLAMSFISCGFHYPISTYDAFFKDRVRKGGAIIVDVRESVSIAEKRVLQTYGETVELTKAANGGAIRFMSQK